MEIETERLLLMPLTVVQLALLIFDRSKLENELCCQYEGEQVEGEFLKILKKQVAVATYFKTIHPDEYPFYTIWVLLCKKGRRIIGTASFKDRPNKAGEVEIGYGLADAHQGFGYMTEAVVGMCDWAFTQEEIHVVTAETDKENLASQRVLTRSGFLKCEVENTETLWWQLKK